MGLGNLRLERGAVLSTLDRGACPMQKPYRASAGDGAQCALAFACFSISVTADFHLARGVGEA